MPLVFGAVRAQGVSVISALAVLAASCFAASAQAADGLEPGVHIDPGSPAAKEYALPLYQGRQTGASSTTASSATATFGAGIHPPGGSKGGSSHRGSTGRVGPSANGSRVGASRSSATVPAVLRLASRQAPSGGDGSILALVGGGVAILVLGGFGGMVMRRNHRATPLA
jgi:hypothetical protein